jgi:hypothetical protein
MVENGTKMGTTLNSPSHYGLSNLYLLSPTYSSRLDQTAGGAQTHHTTFATHEAGPGVQSDTEKTLNRSRGSTLTCKPEVGFR